MDITTILSTIYSKISATTSAEEVLALSKIAEKIKIGNIRTVLTYVEMYTSTDFTVGTVIFVENEEKLYYYSGTNIVPVLGLNSVAYSWGNNNNYGNLGDNTSVAKSSPVSVVGGFTDWIQVSAGNAHALGLRANGTAWAWGYGNSGRLGDNTAVNKSSPVSVVGGYTDWIQVSAGSQHSVGLRSNGTAWAWGNNNGKLGDNSIVSRLSPVSVVGGFTDWVQVEAGNAHNLAIRANGTAWAWGNNNYGKLGNNTAVSKSSPVSIVGGFSDWVQVSAGYGHSLGIRANGTAWAWGVNSFGSAGILGDNTTVAKSSPVSVVGGYTDWIQVSAGMYHSLGLRSNGTAWAWGSNNPGNLGDNTAVAKSSPVSVVGGFTDWVQVSAGYRFSIGLRSNGTAWAWGNGGSLGNNTIVDKSSPVSIVGGFTDWVQISTGPFASAGAAIRTAR